MPRGAGLVVMRSYLMRQHKTKEPRRSIEDMPSAVGRARTAYLNHTTNGSNLTFVLTGTSRRLSDVKDGAGDRPNVC